MDFSRVLKTGLVSGIIYGVMQGITSVFSYVFYREQIKEMIKAAIPSNANIPMTMDQLADIGMMSAIPGSIVGGIIVGIVMAVIFALMYESLMGGNSRKKGIFLCLLLLAGIILGELAYPGFIGGLFMVQTRFILLAPISAAFFVAYGYILGLFYDRFSSHKHKAAEYKKEDKEKPTRKK
ncbi:MAG: hypothetical protein NTU57_04770 [Candidatus Aenigmarchaeota archaeon]|nr:hypothetical protein [Candidatus Aenigmarchaeota archaeon]